MICCVVAALIFGRLVLGAQTFRGWFHRRRDETSAPPTSPVRRPFDGSSEAPRVAADAGHSETDTTSELADRPMVRS
jgi:hypothetical protein